MYDKRTIQNCMMFETCRKRQGLN